MCHVTHDMLEGGGDKCSQNFRSLTVTVLERRCFEDIFIKVDWVTQSVNVVCRTATPGLPNIYVYVNLICVWLSCEAPRPRSNSTRNQPLPSQSQFTNSCSCDHCAALKDWHNSAFHNTILSLLHGGQLTEIALNCIELHYSDLYWATPHIPALHWTAPYLATLHTTQLYYTTLHWALLQWDTLHRLPWETLYLVY